ncbi:hypothetical protein ACRRTK_014409 [Alexandromys fortis]
MLFGEQDPDTLAFSQFCKMPNTAPWTFQGKLVLGFKSQRQCSLKICPPA